EDVVIGAPAPEQSGECHVDHDQRGCNESDLAAKEAKPTVDVAGEDLEEMVDDARAAHDATRRPARRGCGSQRWSRAIRTQPASVSCLASESAAGSPPRRAGMRNRAGRPRRGSDNGTAHLATGPPHPPAPAATALSPAA